MFGKHAWFFLLNVHGRDNDDVMGVKICRDLAIGNEKVEGSVLNEVITFKCSLMEGTKMRSWASQRDGHLKKTCHVNPSSFWILNNKG